MMTMRSQYLVKSLLSIEIIRQHIPRIDIDPDMAQRDAPACTTLMVGEETDILFLDYSLLKVVRTQPVRDIILVTAPFFVVTLIGHGMSHILEFRCARAKGRLAQMGNRSLLLWAQRVGKRVRHGSERPLGGKLHPLCEEEAKLSALRGLVVQSSKLNEAGGGPWCVRIGPRQSWGHGWERRRGL
jgi:hypothetical protein